LVLFHVYVTAPVTLNVAKDCAQMVDADGVSTRTGKLLVVTATVLEPGHPAALVAFTVYTVEIVGVSAMVEPGVVPFQVYVAAPDAAKLICDSEQTVGDAGVIAGVGVGLTVKVIVLTPLHTVVPVPDTVYTVVTIGDTVTEVELDEGVTHVYVFAPLTESVEELPGQMAVGELTICSVGEVSVTTVEIAEVKEFETQPLELAPVTV
jgi:hypothetical protein